MAEINVDLEKDYIKRVAKKARCEGVYTGLFAAINCIDEAKNKKRNITLDEYKESLKELLNKYETHFDELLSDEFKDDLKSRFEENREL